MLDEHEYRRMKNRVDGDLAHLAQERKDLDERRAEIDSECANLEKLNTHLDACIKEKRKAGSPANDTRYPITADMGITEAARRVVWGARGRIIPPTEVRDRMVEVGFKKTHNLLTEIHAALRRLEKQGDIHKKERSGKKGYMGYGPRIAPNSQ